MIATTIAYHGYLLVRNDVAGLVYVTKDGARIATTTSVAYAKRAVHDVIDVTCRACGTRHPGDRRCSCETAPY